MLDWKEAVKVPVGIGANQLTLCYTGTCLPPNTFGLYRIFFSHCVRKGTIVLFFLKGDGACIKTDLLKNTRPSGNTRGMNHFSSENNSHCSHQEKRKRGDRGRGRERERERERERDTERYRGEGDATDGVREMQQIE